MKKHVGKKVRVDGWIYSIRNIGKIWFLILRDGFLQGVVVKGEATDKTFNMEQTLNKEDSVTLVDTKEEPRSVGGYEMSVIEVVLINSVLGEFL